MAMTEKKTTNPIRPWTNFHVQVHPCVEAFFSIVVSEVGDGHKTLFWTDRWIHGQRVADLAPQVFALVSKRKANRRTVFEALASNAWVSDIQGAITVGVISEFLGLWDIFREVCLQPGVEDSHILRLSSNGLYSAQSAYTGLLQGTVIFWPLETIWKSWAPRKCKFFMWLVAHDRCWTADRLAKRGLSHLERCPHCNQEEETIGHLLLSCIFAREFWFRLLHVR
jgi:hypothetical protein